MIIDSGKEKRSLKKESLETDLVVVGGGLSGVCCAITAARHGVRVVLVQDRPVLGGNASSEVRLWILGATSHMGNNNRWAREGGVVGEILTENLYRNPEGNTLILDSILLEKVVEEPNITLLLNTAVFEVDKKGDSISSVLGFCSQNSTEYHIAAPLFCDASGDGIVGFLSGAAFRMGAESKSEFGEKFAPTDEYGELLGHSLYFYTKDVGRKVNYTAPSFALDDITKIPRFRSFNAKDDGCRLWWIEYGGRLDTIHDTETIKWELWKVVYGVWNYIKNSGKFPEAENLTLEWVGTIPGKRESRRFEGDYMLIQQDFVEQRQHPDMVAHGGWAIDLHPADGVFSEMPGCNQYHSKGVYGIPYRTMYSKNVDNLFLAGRIISASHVAFGSTRVMATAAHAAQAVGVAASLCMEAGESPRSIGQNSIEKLQQKLLRSGQFIPGAALGSDGDLAAQADIKVSSTLKLKQLKPNDEWYPLKYSVAQMLPIKPGKAPTFNIDVKAVEATTLKVELRVSASATNHTPDVTLATHEVSLQAGEQNIDLRFEVDAPDEQYLFLCFMQNESISLASSDQRITGMLTVYNKENKAVSNTGKQTPQGDIGFDSFEFWTPERRPEGKNLALSIEPPLDGFETANLSSGINRPVNGAHAWIASLEDEKPTLELTWPEQQRISQVTLVFDADYDHPMESSLMGHPENIVPFVVRSYKIFNNGSLVFEKQSNHQDINDIHFNEPLLVSALTIEFERPSKDVPVALFDIRCY